MGFGIYLTSLGYSRDQLGWVQSVFLLFSYFVPVISGTFADRYGFKKVLVVSYVAYLPAILLLTFTRSFSGIALTMLTIGLAAGIFKPLIAGTVRAVSDATKMRKSLTSPVSPTTDGSYSAATVELIDETDGRTVSYRIVGEDEADITAGLISVTSPIARALIGRKEGDVAVVMAPGGERSYEIVKVQYI